MMKDGDNEGRKEAERYAVFGPTNDHRGGPHHTILVLALHLTWRYPGNNFLHLSNAVSTYLNEI